MYKFCFNENGGKLKYRKQVKLKCDTTESEVNQLLCPGGKFVLEIKIL